MAAGRGRPAPAPATDEQDARREQLRLEVIRRARHFQAEGRRRKLYSRENVAHWWQDEGAFLKAVVEEVKQGKLLPHGKPACAKGDSWQCCARLCARHSRVLQ